MAINFPDSPTSGQTFTASNRTWTYNGTSWVGSYDNTGSADYLDGIDSSQFLRSDTSDTMTGTLTVQGNLKLGTSGDNNWISFYGVTGDVPGSYNTTLIGERIYANTESSELLIWKGNDLGSTSGPDRIRMVGADLCFDTYGTTVSGYYTTINDAGGATTRRIMTLVGTTQNVGIGTEAPDVKLSVAPDTDNSAKIGRAFIGKGTDAGLSDWAIFSHIDNQAANQAALHQSAGGQTVVNAASGQSIRFRIANGDKAIIDSGGNVGINTTSVGTKLHVNGTFQSVGYTNLGGQLYVSGTNTNTLNSGYGVNGSADIWINYRGYADGQTQFRNANIGDGKGANIAWFDGANHRMSLNNAQVASYTLDVNGTVRATGDLISDSDERLKSDIRPIENALALVKQLNGKLYTKDGLENQVGLIAQEVETVLPHLVHTADDEMETKSLNYANMVALLIEAVKELSDQVKEIRSK